MPLHSPHDAEVLEPRAPLRLVLALLRILAGARGHSDLRWHNDGFTYVLTVTRDDSDDEDTDVDYDASARHSGEAAERRPRSALRTS